MMSKRFLECTFASVIAWLALAGQCAWSQRAPHAEPVPCVQLRKLAKSLDARTLHYSPLAKRQEFLRFLHNHPDDPTDCVTSATYAKLLGEERTMIRLSLGGNPPALPEWLLQCNSIDDKTQHCAGLVSDDVPILDNERVEPRFTASLSGSTARIAVDAGMSCKVMNVSAAEAADLRSGKPPQLISGGPGPFSVLSLHGMKTPILIAAIRCGDDLRFRKAAWIFTK